MTLSKEYTDKIIRHELVQVWNEYEEAYRCYSNVAAYYMHEKAKVMADTFNPGSAAVLAAEIAWWVHESCLKKRHKP